jgi:hypothetical protein
MVRLEWTIDDVDDRVSVCWKEASENSKKVPDPTARSLRSDEGEVCGGLLRYLERARSKRQARIRVPSKITARIWNDTSSLRPEASSSFLEICRRRQGPRVFTE